MPTLSQDWGCSQQTPRVLTESLPCQQLIPSLMVQSAVSLPAARPWCKGARGCACIVCAGTLGEKSAKNTSEILLPGKRGFLQIKG